LPGKGLHLKRNGREAMSAGQAGSIDKIEQAVLRAEQQKSAGDYVRALQTLSEAVFERFFSNRAGGFQPLVVDMLAVEKLADLATLFGEIEAADDLLGSLQKWYAQAGNKYFFLYASIKRIHLLLGGARLDEAYEALRSLIPEIEEINLTPVGLAAWEAERFGDGSNSTNLTAENHDDRALLLANLYLEMGRVLSAYGQYSDALTALERGQLVAANGSPYLMEAVILHTKVVAATVLLEKGDLPAARSALRELSGLSEKSYPGLVVRREELFSKLGLMTGEFGISLSKSVRVLELCTAYGFRQAASVAALNLAHIMIYLNQTGKARGILSDIRDHALKRQDDTIATRADYLLAIADARGRSLAEGVSIAPTVTEMWQGSVKKMSSQQSQTISPLLLPAVDDYLSFFEDRALGFHWYIGNFDFASAARYLDEITEVFNRCDSQLIRTRLQLMRGMLFYYEGRYSEAEAIFDEMRAILHKLGLLPEHWQAQRFLGWCWERLGRSEDELLKLAEETGKYLSQMTNSLPPENQVVFLLNKWTADEEYIAREINKLAAMKKAAARAPKLMRPMHGWRIMKRLCALLAHIDLYKDRVARKAVQSSQKTSYKFTAWSLIRRLLFHSGDHHTIALLVLPDRVFVVSFGKLTLDFGVSPLTRLQVREAVAEWHSLRDYGAKSRNLIAGPKISHDSLVARRSEIAAHLADFLQLHGIFEGLHEKVRALTIVPDDSLQGFPFAALIYNGQYLIERFAISIGLTISGREASREEGVRETLVVGVSHGAQSDEFGWIPPLPGTIPEIYNVKHWLASRGAKVLCINDSEAGDGMISKNMLLQHIQNAELAHFACHGIFKPDQPDQSGLIIVYDNQVEILSLRDFAQLDLSKMRHITLSACWLADSFVLPGRWVISLPEVLWRAGAGSILGSLWPVDDTIAGEIMARFYQYLTDMPRDIALQKVLTECALGELDKTVGHRVTDPYYWAGYHLYGNNDCFDVVEFRKPTASKV
jgi:tetratricopeptide (TPR) repeat protein